MISKIEKLKNIGNYEDYNATGNVALGKWSIIYAANGAGKTTLARVLQSLSTGDGSIIGRHKRIGAASDPEAVILSDTPARHSFRNGSWNQSLPEVAVFDSHFVANNVYSGFEINPEHHKKLYEFVVGDAGVEIIRKIERVKNMISVCNSNVAQQSELIKAATKYQDVDKVCGLPKKDNVDELIKAKEEELNLAKGQAQILSQAMPKEMVYNLPLSAEWLKNAKTVLELTVDGIGKEYLEMVQAHLQHIGEKGIQNSTEWVFRGTKAMDNCPFCGQNLEGVALVKGYNQFFNERYRDAVSKAETLKNQSDKINMALFLQGLKTQYQQLEAVLKVWNTMIPNQPTIPGCDIEALKLEEAFDELKAVIARKAANPVVAVGSAELERFSRRMNSLVTVVTNVNVYVKEYLKKVLELRGKIRPVNDVEKELKALQIYKMRYEAPLMGYCAQYQILQHQVDRLRRINTELQRQQKAASNLLFTQYGTKINNYLSNVFRTPFQIVDVKDGGFRGTSRRPNLDYTLTFNGTPITQDDGLSNQSFKNVLSEGDKNTIAFSFFLAKLTSDPHYNDKIVVFDDPLTSLDLNRRNATIEQLVKLYRECKQVIVLSHNIHFLIDLNGRKQILGADKQCLQIVNVGGRSELRKHNIKSDWIDKYKKALTIMSDFVANPDPNNQDDAMNSIRLSLETFLKLKFCQFIPDSNLTFGKLVYTLSQSGCQFVNSDRAAVIEKLSNLDSVSWRTHHGSVEEMATYHEVTLELAEAVGYVQTTLDLLANEL